MESKKVVLIACSSKKLKVSCEAEKMYQSELFKNSLAYAKALNPDQIFILSAKYGLLDLHERIDPYNESLNGIGKKGIIKWSNLVLHTLNDRVNINDSTFIFLAGINYRIGLISSLKNIMIPMEGLRIGKQLQFLKDKISK